MVDTLIATALDLIDLKHLQNWFTQGNRSYFQTLTGQGIA
jgi:hypothetical protein